MAHDVIFLFLGVILGGIISIYSTEIKHRIRLASLLTRRDMCHASVVEFAKHYRKYRRCKHSPLYAVLHLLQMSLRVLRFLGISIILVVVGYFARQDIASGYGYAGKFPTIEVRIWQLLCGAVGIGFVMRILDIVWEIKQLILIDATTRRHWRQLLIERQSLRQAIHSKNGSDDGAI